MDEASDAFTCHSYNSSLLNNQIIDFLRSSVITHITLEGYLVNDASLLQQLNHLWFQVRVIVNENNSCQLSSIHSIDQIAHQLENIRCSMKNLITKADWKSGQDLDYRIAYAFATLFKVLLDICSNAASPTSLESVLKQIDDGLIMCPPICKNILATLGQKINDILVMKEQQEQEDQKCHNSIMMKSKKASLASSCPSSPLESIEFPKVNCNIAVESALDLMNFQSKYLITRSPVIIKDTISHWRALSHWNVNYFRQVFGSRWVPVEIGSSYLDTEWRQEVMKFDEFACHYLLSANTTCTAKGYLAQYNLFHQIPLLRRDISIPDYCSISDSNNDDDDVQINTWIGPSGTVSPLHRDPMDNLLSQVYGYKYVKLISSSVSDQVVYPFDGSSKMSNTSQVNIEQVDLSRFPRFIEAEQLTFQCILGPGDILFIPKGWWHFVKSLSSSCSISFWW